MNIITEEIITEEIITEEIITEEIITEEIITEEYILPDYLAGPLINGDYSGLNEEEYRQLITWLNDEKPGYCVSVNDDSSFYHSHDFNAIPLAGNCSTFIFINR